MTHRRTVLVVEIVVFLIYISSLLTSIEGDDFNQSHSVSRHARGTRRQEKNNNEDEDSNKEGRQRRRTKTEDAEGDDEDEPEDMDEHENKPSKPKGNKDVHIIFEEQFNFRNWSSQWTHAHNANETKLYNKFSRVYVRKSNHSRPNYGIITNNKDGEFYMLATTFPPFNNRNETLVIQFSVQFQSRAHCQLAFLRLYDCQFSTEDFNLQTPYLMQVGPHICGTSGVNRLSAEFQEPGRSSISPVDKDIEPINNTSVNLYALALESDGTYHIIVNTNSTQNGTLQDDFKNYKGYTSICAVGLVVWHSVLDKYFKGQIIIDDILIVNDMEYAEKQRNQILNAYAE